MQGMNDLMKLSTKLSGRSKVCKDGLLANTLSLHSKEFKQKITNGKNSRLLKNTKKIKKQAEPNHLEDVNH